MAKDKIEIVEPTEEERRNIVNPPQDDRLKYVDEIDREEGRRESETYGEHEQSTAEREMAMQITDPERRREIRRKWMESILPNLPYKSGWHRCWVGTTHSIDTPQKRRRFGYKFVDYDDLNREGWAADVDAVKDGRFMGAVMWREMIAMECTIRDFVDYMREFHHDQPEEMTAGIFQNLDEMNDTAKQKGGKITLDEGIEDMRKRMMRPPARQFEV